MNDIIPEEIRNAANPYLPITANLPVRQFIGREDEQNVLYNMLEDFKRTSIANNILISGEKSIGKSSLLNRFEQILQDYNIITYSIELSRYTRLEIDEFEFFYELIDDIFNRYSSSENSFFDSEQAEIWYSLTSGAYEHESSFLKRELRFATAYANKKNGIQERLSYKQLERDFALIIKELHSIEVEINGFAILIDEFQVLANNPTIVDTLRQLTEKLSPLMVIGSGLPSLLEQEVFEKFNRISIPINLKGMKRETLLDFIFKPLQEIGNYTRFEVQRWCNPYAIRDIVERSGGNPLHVKILCSKMFEYAKQTPSCSHFELNGNVMKDVMEYYSNMSDKSRSIRSALGESCSREQLEAFKLLYEFEGFSIRGAILLKLAFSPINLSNEELIRHKILDAFDALSGLNLFEFSDPTTTVGQLREMSSNQLSQIVYKFIGTPIDKLYASYFYELTLDQQLYDNQDLSFEDMLAHKLGLLLNLSSLAGESFPETLINIIQKSPKFVHVIDHYELEDCQGKQIIEDLETLVKLSETNSEKSEEDIRTLSEKHHLSFPSFIARFLELQGFYMIIADISIRGKRKIIYDLFPVMVNAGEIVEISRQVTDLSSLNPALNDYMVNINYVCVFWLPQAPLSKITHLEMVSKYQLLVAKVKEAKFDQAIQIADHLHKKDIRLHEKHFVTTIDTYNNYGFCLINIDQLEEAIEVLEDCSNKSIVSKANLAYVYFLQGELKKAKKMLSGMIRKRVGEGYQTRFMHLAINHPKLTKEYRIVEDCELFNIAAWNAALLNAQLKDPNSSTYSFLRKVRVKGHENINKRVLSWIKFFENDISKSLKISNEILSSLGDNENIRKLILKDIEIFEDESRQLSLAY